MGKYTIVVSSRARKELQAHHKSGNQKTIKKIEQIFLELSETPSDLPSDSPANEHVSMQMAKQLYGIRTAECCFMRFANGTPAYVTRRFDYNKDEEKLNQEDFASVLQAKKDNDGKYKYIAKSYEDFGDVLSPLNKVEFIRILIFNFLTGNGDAHLKNFSLLETSDGDMQLSPSYDLMNTKLHVNDSPIALNLFREL